MTATGGRGPNLVAGVFARGDSDDSIKRVIRIGVPGTTMPAFSEFTDEETGQIIGYVRGLSKAGTQKENITGDPAKGKEIYAANGCAGCHRIGSQGSIFGPELTRIGSARSLAYLHESIVNPSADVPEAFEGVTVTLKDNSRIRGIRINEDTFSIQLRAPNQKIRMFQKSDVKDVAYEQKSLMPAYDKLAAADLDNLVAYLAGLRAAVDSSATVNKAKGIK